MPGGDPSGGFRRPRKRFGQHFLTDRRILERIADALGVEGTSRVVEIGAGRGALTDILAVRAGILAAVEIDRALAALLRARYESNEVVRIIEGDALRLDWSGLVGTPYLLTGNLPYNLTTPLLFKALEPPLPERAVFLVQREVAERIAAREGGRDYGALTVNIQVATVVDVVAHVPAGAFHPRPKVDSAIIRLIPRPIPLLDVALRGDFRRFVQAMFGMRRKQLGRALREVDGCPPDVAARILDLAGLTLTARPETLTPERWVTLFSCRDGGRATLPGELP